MFILPTDQEMSTKRAVKVVANENFVRYDSQANVPNTHWVGPGAALNVAANIISTPCCE